MFSSQIPDIVITTSDDNEVEVTVVGVSLVDEENSYSYSGEWSVEICEGITTIGEGAFLDWSYLREVHIPKSVTLIYENAFWFAAITDIYYAGSAEDWAKIQVIPCGDSANCTLNTATMHFNVD